MVLASLTRFFLFVPLVVAMGCSVNTLAQDRPTLARNATAQGLALSSDYQQVFIDYVPSDASYLDSLSEAMMQSYDTLQKIMLLNDLAYYWHTRNLLKADSLAQLALKYSDSEAYEYQKALTQVRYAAILLRREMLEDAQILLETAMLRLKEADWPLALTQLGYVAERKGQLEAAAEFANQNLGISTNYQNFWGQAMALSDLSNLFWKQGRFQDGLDIGRQALAIFKNRGIPDLDYDFTYYVVANNLIGLKRNDDALNYLDSAIVIGERYGFYNNLSDIYIATLDIYTDLEDFKKAELSFKLSMRYADLLDNAFMKMRTWLSHGRMLNKAGQYNEAIASLKRSLEVATDQFGDQYWLLLVYEQLAEAYVGKGDYENAYQFMKSFTEYKDKTLTLESQKKISELHAQYEAKERESTISLQSIRLNRQNILLMSTALLLSFFGVGAFLLFRFNSRLRFLNANLKTANIEKDFLLKEIHHRVKNNLQILSSLLNLQSDHIQDKTTADALREGRNRVESMGLIHQRLYTTDHLAAVNMPEYVSELVAHLVASFGRSKNTLEIKTDIQVSLVDVDTAIPLGLIINELITNSIKHAFVDGQKAIVHISLRLTENNQLLLSIRDNGQKMKTLVDTKNLNSFGSSLIVMLTKKLKGELTVDTRHGYHTIIRFTKFKTVERTKTYASLAVKEY